MRMQGYGLLTGLKSVLSVGLLIVVLKLLAHWFRLKRIAWRTNSVRVVDPLRDKKTVISC
jgi:hypothetical protein